MEITIRDAHPLEFKRLGQLMVEVYENLKGFPGQLEQPAYYKKLANIGSWTQEPHTRLLVALTKKGQLGGAVVYFSNMASYGSGGTATLEKNAAGFRLLAVGSEFRGLGLGKLLTQACIDLARADKVEQIIIHSTKAMQIAWGMYKKMGFRRSKDLDFMQGDLKVYGFRLFLS